MCSLTYLLHIQLLPNVTLCNKISESELLDHSMGDLKVAMRTLVEFEELRPYTVSYTVIMTVIG